MDPGQHLLGGQQVEPGGRLVADEQIGPEGELPGQQRALDIAARELEDRLIGVAGPDVEAGDQVLRELADLELVQPDPFGEGRRGDPFQGEVDRQARPRHAADRDPLVGGHADAGIDQDPGAGVGQRPAVDLEQAMVDVPLAREDLGQLLLAVALDTGDAEHLAGAELERQITQGQAHRDCPAPRPPAAAPRPGPRRPVRRSAAPIRRPVPARRTSSRSAGWSGSAGARSRPAN